MIFFIQDVEHNVYGHRRYVSNRKVAGSKPAEVT